MKEDTVEIKKVQPERVRWNWFAFFLGGIWAAYHKVYWPIVIQLVFVLLSYIVYIPSPPPDYDEYRYGRFILSDEQCLLSALLNMKYFVFVAIHIFLAKRGNALKMGQPLFRRFTRETLVRKKFNWLAMFGGGCHGIIIHRYWMLIPLIVSLHFLIVLMVPLPDEVYSFLREYGNVIGYIEALLLMACPIIMILSGLLTNSSIIKLAKADDECAALYGKCRLISIASCLYFLWFALYFLEIMAHGE